MLKNKRILLLFTYAKIEYDSVRTYLSKIEYVRYVSSSLGSYQPLRDIRRCISRKPLEIEAWFQRMDHQ